MKKLISLLVAAACCMGMALADSAEGNWKSVDESGAVTAQWKIYEKDGKLFGHIIHVKDQDDATLATACKESYKDFPVEGKVNEMTVVGAPFIYNLEKQGEGKWSKGNIIDPGDGKCYSCSITFHAADGKKYAQDTLEMRGSIGPFGRSQYWLRDE